MTNHPRIYSITTVGVIMHYNQDYLLHRVRTDFTGRNGIGKSLIADLIQLVFITERKLIVFGTDSVKKKVREVHTLPYNTSDAYVFMNIEVSPDQFVVIGVNIPNKKSRPIRSFWILNRPHNDQDNHDLKALCIEKPNLVMNRDFIVDGKIPSMERLAVHLRESKGLYMRHFTDSNQKQEFYSFLYYKELLPINLTIEEHRKTFARIIQSFSKAKSLNTDSDKSLKEFLFESDEEELQEQFENNQRDLEKVLQETRELDQYTKELTTKQNRLSNLKELDDERIRTHQKHLSTKVVVTDKNLKTATSELDTEEKKRDASQAELTLLKEKTLPQLKKQIEEGKAAVKTTTENLETLKKYKEAFDEKSKIEEGISDLLKIELPDISSEKPQLVDMESFDFKEMARRVQQFLPIYEKYGSLIEMEKKTNDQKTAIASQRNALAQNISNLEQVKGLISMNKEGTLFAKLFDEKKTLSPQQETVLMAVLSNALIGKPTKAHASMRYVLGLEVLDEKWIEEDEANEGYWLKMGGVHEFVPRSGEQQLFADANQLAEAVKNKTIEIDEKITTLKKERLELDRFEEGKNYNSSVIQIEDELDENLVDHTSLNQFKETLGIIQNLTTEISKRNSKIKELDDRLTKSKAKLPAFDDQLLQEELDKYATKLSSKTKHERELTEDQIKKSERVKSLESSLPLQNQIIQTKKKEKEELEADWKAFSKEYKEAYPHALPEDSEEIAIPLSELQAEHKTARESYLTEYRAIAGSYANTMNKPEITEQIESGYYSFSILEVALLGVKIKHTDKITQALDEANGEREKLIKTLHQTMLKIFSITKKKYGTYKDTIKDLNIFFGARKISEKYTFRINIKPHPQFKIDWIDQLQNNINKLYRPGELPLGVSVENFVEDFFQKATNYKQRMALTDLLDPKTYFEVETKLTDDAGNEKPGSTGESYSAIVLLGIGRLSIIQKGSRKGIKFVILEETANLDRVNFNTFPDIAEDFGYQILTMTPRPYGSDADQGWYLYHLLEGFDDPNINYPIPSSYFKTNEDKKDLMTYLSATAE